MVRRKVLRGKRPHTMNLFTSAALAAFSLMLISSCPGSSDTANPRLELFADNHILANLKGGVERVLQKPDPKEVVLVTDAPWEGTTCAYFSLFQDGSLYRMYYRAKDEGEGSAERTCMAISDDGITWEKPELGIHAYNGSRQNNIILMDDHAVHNFAAFKDTNPAAAEDERYKAIGQSRGPRLYVSPDGIHWRMKADKALVEHGTFDSQNILQWDSYRQEYRLYWRDNPIRQGGLSYRAISTATSKDLKTWDDMQFLRYTGQAEPIRWRKAVQLYTSAIQPYVREPRFFIGFPTQFLPGKEQTQPLFMISRDGFEFRRYDEPVIPLDAQENRDGNRSNFMAWGMLQLPGREDELSVYAAENYRNQGPVRLRRFAYRVDGFVALQAGDEEGEVVTRPLAFSGNTLYLNYKTKKNGYVKVELVTGTPYGGTDTTFEQSIYGFKPVDGFTAADCDTLTGDSISQQVSWRGDPHIPAALLQNTIKLRFLIKDASLYSIRF